MPRCSLLSLPLLFVAAGCSSNIDAIPGSNAESGNSEPSVQAEHDLSPIRKTDAEWQKLLTPQQYHVARQKGTERQYSGAYWNEKREGTYLCVCCGLPLFSSEHKFESGTGWPSYYQPIRAGNVKTEEDNSHYMTRMEVLCTRCDAHLGHVFDDGPKPTGLRYCMNSASLRFEEAP